MELLTLTEDGGKDDDITTEIIDLELISGKEGPLNTTHKQKSTNSTTVNKHSKKADFFTDPENVDPNVTLMSLTNRNLKRRNNALKDGNQFKLIDLL